MNLNEITTVNDLVAANEATPEVMSKADIWQAILQQDAPAAMDLAKAIISQLGSWHDDVATAQASEGNLENAAMWAKDEARFHIVWDILNGIEVG